MVQLFEIKSKILKFLRKRAVKSLRAVNMEATEKRDRRRGAFEVLCKTAEDIASWFLPFVMVDGVAQSMRAFLMESTDLRGPWECLWHKVGKLRARIQHGSF